MTISDIVSIMDGEHNQCAILGWHEDNIPQKENWMEEKCYYYDHDSNTLTFFYDKKIPGERTFKKTFKTLSLNSIKKVNGECVHNKTITSTDNGRIMLNFIRQIHNWKNFVTMHYNHKFSKRFNDYWTEVLECVIENNGTSDIQKSLKGIHKKTLVNIVEDIKQLVVVAYVMNKYFQNNTKEEIDTDTFCSVRNYLLTFDINPREENVGFFGNLCNLFDVCVNELIQDIR